MQACEYEDRQIAEDLAAVSQDPAAHRTTRNVAFEWLREMARDGSQYANRLIARLSGQAQRRRNAGTQPQRKTVTISTRPENGPTFSGRESNSTKPQQKSYRPSGFTIGDAIRAKHQEKKC